MTYPLLDGLRVVEFGESISAPYCGKLLADMGAEVVKIERPGGGIWRVVPGQVLEQALEAVLVGHEGRRRQVG